MKRKTILKIYLTFWLIVVSALILATIYQSTALNRDLTRIPGSIKTKLPSIILIGSLAQIFMIRTVHSMKKALSGFHTGMQADKELVFKVHRGVKTLGKIYIIVNSIGFFLGPAITFVIYHFIGRYYPPLEIFFIIAAHLLLGAVISLLQLSILQISMFEIMDSFQVHRVYPELKRMPVVRKRRLVILSMLGLFAVLTAGQAYGLLNSIALGNIPQEPEILRLVAGFLIHTLVYILFFMFVFFVLSREEQNKLIQLQKSMENNQTYEGEGFSQINIIAHDDYGMLASAVNSFTSRLAYLITSISKAGQTVGTTSRELQQSIDMSEQSLETLQLINNEIYTEISNEQQVINSVSEAIGVLTGSIRTLGDAVTDQAAFVEQSSAAISEMSANTHSVSQISRKALNVTVSLNDMIGNGSTRLSETVTSINTLNDASEKVQSIIKVIQRISAQTNLLAMNAAIEAAHAGEVGAGFSVVADEVRKLAEESSNSANEIKNIITEMATAIGTGVDAASKTSEAFELITKSVGDTSQIINTVTAAMEEQQTAAGEITSAMSSLVDVSETLKLQIKEQLSSSEILNSTYGKLTAATTALEQKSTQQQEEDNRLANIIKSLHSVSRKNSEAVESLEKAADIQQK